MWFRLVVEPVETRWLGNATYSTTHRYNSESIFRSDTVACRIAQQLPGKKPAALAFRRAGEEFAKSNGGEKSSALA
jgi:hypothetical protein